MSVYLPANKKMCEIIFKDTEKNISCSSIQARTTALFEIIFPFMLIKGCFEKAFKWNNTSLRVLDTAIAIVALPVYLVASIIKALLALVHPAIVFNQK